MSNSSLIITNARIVNEGSITEADLVLVDPNRPNTVRRKDLLYKCGWPPLEGYAFRSSVRAALVNGGVIWLDGQLSEVVAVQRLEFV